MGPENAVCLVGLEASIVNSFDIEQHKDDNSERNVDNNAANDFYDNEHCLFKNNVKLSAGSGLLLRCPFSAFNQQQQQQQLREQAVKAKRQP